ncbi:MAG: hypothetical protein FWF67_02715 [Fibromonadales bacterium]|nr:hypothetical protein [Fibromonadales bacterium]
MLKRKKFLLLALLTFVLFFGACYNQQPPVLQNMPLTNPNATIAYFGESNTSFDMRREYAYAMQKAGYYNFVLENFSEEQLLNPIEVRLDYSEERGAFTGIPTQVIKAEFIKNGAPWFKLTLKEYSDKLNLHPRGKIAEKKYRQKILLDRFIEEVKRVKSQEPSEKREG